LALIHKGETPVKDSKKAAEDAEAKKDVFYIMIAVFGTLLIISALMVLTLLFYTTVTN
jgi:farnesyl-diphosphate farnesyltransferase